MSTPALRARKWSGFICKRVSKDDTIALSLLKKEEEEKKKVVEECQIVIFFYFERRVSKLRYYRDGIHDGGV